MAIFWELFKSNRRDRFLMQAMLDQLFMSSVFKLRSLYLVRNLNAYSCIIIKELDLGGTVVWFSMYFFIITLCLNETYSVSQCLFVNLPITATTIVFASNSVFLKLERNGTVSSSNVNQDLIRALMTNMYISL